MGIQQNRLFECIILRFSRNRTIIYENVPIVSLSAVDLSRAFFLFHFFFFLVNDNSRIIVNN